jgi:hypothetical protein
MVQILLLPPDTPTRNDGGALDRESCKAKFLGAIALNLF